MVSNGNFRNEELASDNILTNGQMNMFEPPKSNMQIESFDVM